MGAGPSSTTSTSTTTPPPWVVPYEKYALQQGLGQYFPGAQIDPKTGQISGGGPTPFPGAQHQVAPFDPSQLQAMGAIGQMGAFNPLASAVQNQQLATTGGAYLGPNPYLANYADEAARNMTAQYERSTAPDITAQAVSQGALGSSGHAQEQSGARQDLSTGLGTLYANIYEPAYQYERGLQQQAAGLMPSTVGGQYIAPQQLLGAGALGQTQLQNILNTGTQNVNQQANWPFQMLSSFGQLPGIAGGGTQTTISPNLSQGIK